MLRDLIPWKKQASQVKVHQDDYPIVRLRHDLDRLFDRFWDNGWASDTSLWDNRRWFGPPVDFQENEKQYVLRAELPGFEPEDIDVKVSGQMLTVRAERQESSEDDKHNGSYRRYGSFYESFALPECIVADQIDARYHSGVLEVRLPKGEESQAKRIEVTSA
jgi:HSP20 family protein